MNKSQDVLTVSSLEELVVYSRGNLVKFPPFGEGQPFVARIKRPSMLELVKNGSIPNSLLSTANELFAGKEGSIMDSDDGESMKNLFDVFDVLCSACFVEPTFKEMKDAGVVLTDEQLIFVFKYTQHGVKALEPFRGVEAGIEPDHDVENVQGNAV